MPSSGIMLGTGPDGQPRKVAVDPVGGLVIGESEDRPGESQPMSETTGLKIVSELRELRRVFCAQFNLLFDENLEART